MNNLRHHAEYEYEGTSRSQSHSARGWKKK
jgi:hypothetical protein